VQWPEGVDSSEAQIRGTLGTRRVLAIIAAP
jgi:hypothetical protein